MENYKPPFKITDDMLMLISQIAEKVAKVNPIKKSDAKWIAFF